MQKISQSFSCWIVQEIFCWIVQKISQSFPAELCKKMSQNFILLDSARNFLLDCAKNEPKLSLQILCRLSWSPFPMVHWTVLVLRGLVLAVSWAVPSPVTDWSQQFCRGWIQSCCGLVLPPAKLSQVLLRTGPSSFAGAGFSPVADWTCHQLSCPESCYGLVLAFFVGLVLVLFLGLVLPPAKLSRVLLRTGPSLVLAHLHVPPYSM